MSIIIIHNLSTFKTGYSMVLYRFFYLHIRIIRTYHCHYNFFTTPLNLPITKGIYRYSRHPMYFDNLIIFLGTGIATVSWIIIIISIVFLILADIYVVAEERYYSKKYGNLYQKYIDSAPKWLGIPQS